MSVKYFNEDIAFPKVKKRITSNWIKQVISIEEKPKEPKSNYAVVGL